MLPQLRKLERRFRDELVVIGVHSPKFPTERETENLRQAVVRLGIEHPVINDRDFVVWQAYAGRAWPTLYFIDPNGKVIGRHEGELPYPALEALIEDMVREFDALGLLDRRPLRFPLEREKLRPSALAFPGKVLADEASSRLFIADTNHNRVLVADFNGQVIDVIGTGEPGLTDGPAEEARFAGPQGLALMGSTLFVADTENHAVRQVDLVTGNVRTVAGTGVQGRPFTGARPAAETALNSPWDLVSVDGRVYIAMAGCHQIWVLDLDRRTVEVFAGTGYEGLKDGPRELAWLAQTSGLATDGERLYFADSETSSIRMVGFEPRSPVMTLVGQDLFIFGDVDGVGAQVRLQHPLGVAWHEGILYVADTYNHKIKRLYPKTRACYTWLGSGEPGWVDGVGRAAQFAEPGGLSVAAGRVFIADTNNHCIRAADLTTGEVTTLNLRF